MARSLGTTAPERTGIARDVGRLAFVGLAASGSVWLAMVLARRRGLTQVRFPHVLGTVFGPRSPGTRALGWTLFLANGVVLTTGYRVLLAFVAPARRVRAGAMLGVVHGLVAASGAALLARAHPRPRQAGLRLRGRSRRPRPSTLAVIGAVHVVFGAVIGGFESSHGGKPAAAG